jgi:hypothetical protein
MKASDYTEYTRSNLPQVGRTFLTLNDINTTKYIGTYIQSWNSYGNNHEISSKECELLYMY